MFDHGNAPTREQTRHFWAELKLRLLTHREMKFFFPDGQIIVERLLGMEENTQFLTSMP